MNHMKLCWLLLATIACGTHAMTLPPTASDVTDADAVPMTTQAKASTAKATEEQPQSKTEGLPADVPTTTVKAEEEDDAEEEGGEETTEVDASTTVVSKKSDEDGVRDWLAGIVGASVAGVIVVGIGIAAAAYYYFKKRRNNSDGGAKYTVANNSAAEPGSDAAVEVTKVESKLLEEKDVET